MMKRKRETDKETFPWIVIKEYYPRMLIYFLLQLLIILPNFPDYKFYESKNSYLYQYVSSN